MITIHAKKCIRRGYTDRVGYVGGVVLIVSLFYGKKWMMELKKGISSGIRVQRL